MRRPFLRAAAALSAAPLLAAADNGAKTSRVVVQVSEADPARWMLALGNVRNLQEELGADRVSVEIVAYGPGIGMLKRDAPVSSQVADAVKAGVTVAACRNTMRHQELVEADMLAGVTYVAAGVAEIVRRQQAGWVYLRP